MLQSFGWRHFQRWKISQGRRHKDYLDKSEIGSVRNLERSSHKILSNTKSAFIENEVKTYSVAKQKIEIDMGLQLVWAKMNTVIP